MKKMKGLSKKKKSHRQRQQYGDYQREMGVGGGRRGCEGIKGDGRRLGEMNMEYNIQMIVQLKPI